jgi:hypothetical protein
MKPDVISHSFSESAFAPDCACIGKRLCLHLAAVSFCSPRAEMKNFPYFDDFLMKLICSQVAPWTFSF